MARKNSAKIEVRTDGIADVEQTMTADIGTNSSSLYIGTNGPGLSGGPFMAAMHLDELRISNTARSDAWIKAEYASLFGTLITIN